VPRILTLMTCMLALGASGAPAAERDTAVGSGEGPFFTGVGGAHFAFSATVDADGGRPAGHVSTKGDLGAPGPFGAFTAHGAVTCVRVEGNRATFKWRFTHTTGSIAPFAGGGIESYVEDNGVPRGGVPVDRVTIGPPLPAGAFEATAHVCDDPALHPPYTQMTSGNVTVRDASGR
jgi:hypothetical protein